MNNQISKKKIWLVGDSTVCSFNDAYLYPRYGYGTQLFNYFNDNVNIQNLAISGRSSKSFIKEKSYLRLKDEIKESDYLIIGFGHNDEKYDDNTRFTSALYDENEKESFAYYLLNYYVKLALEKKAIPILCTPVARANKNNDYTSFCAHITENGDYRNRIITLALKYDITCIDLTKQTVSLYEKIGYDNAVYFHARKLSSLNTVDTTHLNYFGAKMVAYIFANELSKSNCSLKNYLLEERKEPTIKTDFISNPNFVEMKYEPLDLDKYIPKTFAQFKSKEWYGTAFGDTTKPPISNEAGFIAKEEDNHFIVGQKGKTYGKIALDSDGLAFVFRQIHKNDKFVLSAKCKIKEINTFSQSGFGIMLRDDIYVEQEKPNNLIISNYVCSGAILCGDKCKILYCRENALRIDEPNFAEIFGVDDEIKLYISSTGQTITTRFVYKGINYEKVYYDFDLFSIDTEYCYVGFYATRGIVIDVTDVNFEITGKTLGA